MKVSIVIPNYNGECLLKTNLPYVFAAAEYYKEKSGQDVEVIVVDDSSKDKSIEELKKINNKIVLLQNHRNLGFSSTVNKGVREARGDIVVLLNTDVKPQKDFLLPLVEHFNNEKVFAVGCMDKSVENGKVVLRGRGIGQWRRGFLVHQRGEVNKIDTLWVNGGSGAFKKSIWEKLGGFNELYNPFYWEDIDLSYRALKLDYKTIFEPKSVVVHEHEKGAIKEKYSQFQIKVISYKNQFIFVWKNITDVDFQFQHICWFPYHFLIAFKSKDWAFFVGFFHAFILLPQIIKYSFNEQKLFIKRDKEVLKEYIE